jgi:hypothetical protein
MERKSLMDGIEKRDKAPGRAKSSGGGGGTSKSKADRIKLGLALALFVVAIGLIAWYADLLPFGRPAPPPPPSAEQVQEFKKRDAEIKKLEQAGKVQNAGSE